MILFILFLSLLIGGIFCIGVWEATRGEEELDPKGNTRKVDDQILYIIKSKLDKKQIVKVYYEEDALKTLHSHMCYKIPYIQAGRKIHGACIEAFNSSDLINIKGLLEKESSSDEFKDIVFEYDYNYNYIKAYKKYTEYKYSKWLRKPIVGCYKCFASFYGLPIYSFVYYLGIKNSIINFSLFEFIAGIVLNTFMLVYINMFFKKQV